MIMSYREPQKFSVFMISLALLSVITISIELNYFMTDQFIYTRYLMKFGLGYGKSTSECLSETPVRNNHTWLKRIHAQQHTTILISVQNSLTIVLGTFSSMGVDYISEYSGRRTALLWIALAESLYLLVSSMTVLLEGSPTILVLARLIEATLCGGLVSAIAQTSVCAVDMMQTPVVVMEQGDANKRGQEEYGQWVLLVLYDTVATLGTVMGFALAGTVLEYRDFDVAVLVALAFYTLVVVLVFFIPETHRPTSMVDKADYRLSIRGLDDGTPDSTGSGVNFRFMVDGRNFVRLTQHRTQELIGDIREFSQVANPASILAIALLFIISIVSSSDRFYTFLYLMRPPFCWNVFWVGLYCASAELVHTICSTVFGIISLFCQPQPRSHEESPATTEVNSSETGARKLTKQKSVRAQWKTYQRRLFKLLFTGTGCFCVSKLLMGVATIGDQHSATILVLVGWWSWDPCHLTGVTCIDDTHCSEYIRFAPDWDADALLLNAFGSILAPIVRSLMFTLTPIERQGSVFPLTAVAERAGFWIGATITPLVYGFTLTTFAGSVYIINTCLLVITLVLQCLMKLYSRNVPTGTYQ